MSDSNIFVRYTSKDVETPPVYPFWGVIGNRIHKRLVALVAGLVPNGNKNASSRATSAQNLRFIKRQLRDAPIAMVGMRGRNGASDVVKVLPKIRKCRRHTSTMVAPFAELLQPIINEAAQKLPIKPTGLEFQLNHFDVMLYRKGDMFHNHRDDQIFAYHVKRKHTYTLLVCLDSNITEPTQGCTKVYLPFRSQSQFAQKFDVYEHRNTNPDRMRNMEKHIYAESVTPGNFLVFGSGLLHAGLPIRDVGKFKLVLKFDLTLHVPMNVPRYLLDRPYSHECSCVKCRPKPFLAAHVGACLPSDLSDLVLEYTAKLPTACDRLRQHFPTVVIQIIEMYATDRGDCRCSKPAQTCGCTCRECDECFHGDVKKPRFREEDYDVDDVDSEDNFCNGYDHTY